MGPRPNLPVAYEIESETSLRRVLKMLAEHFPLERSPALERHLVCLDTFDWRLYRADARLSAVTRGQGTLLRLEVNGSWCESSLNGSVVPAFSWELPAGDLHDLIAPLIDVRCLLPLVNLQVREQALRILNADQKTVVRLTIEHTTVTTSEGGQPVESLQPVLRLAPVKGYQKAARRVTDFLESELKLARSSPDPMVLALAAIGRTPGDRRDRLTFELDSAMRCDAALRTIHRTQLDTMRLNEDGVRRNLDSEFLHEFRVAVRRTRAALAQVRGVYPPDVVAHFKKEFRWLGGVTGPVRDLDVYLFMMDDYRAELPEALGDELTPLHEHLRRHHRSEHRRLVRALGSERYQTLLHDWQQFLDTADECDPEFCPNATRPLAEVSSQRIWKAFRRVVSQGRAITAETPAEALHRLRIECKKLRYLMEFFRSIHDPKQIGRLIRALKKLQVNLGDFNDLEIQQGSLERFALEMSEEGEAPVRCLMAMGRLVDHLYERQKTERTRFSRCFARFSTSANEKRFRRLFKR